MAADELLTIITAWTDENSHRGRLARAYQTNLGSDAVLQAKRIGMLGIYVERQVGRKALV
ncbi:hypothetical protein ACFYWN_29265 [Streptomyces sp. NPDC002917]|uniref:hypothetical protein n=1 Tax=Streptomyces sp. NPDC002917 TaxID=3364671 RepID=UPI0036A595F4